MSPYKEVTPNKGVWGVKGSFIYPFFPASLWQPNTPMHSRIAEIESYLRHNDHCYNGRFAYVSFEEFRKLNITADTKAQTFIMKVVSEKDNTIDYIKSLMK